MMAPIKIAVLQKVIGGVEHSGIEMFDTFIPEVGGMLRLADIRKAYLNASDEPYGSRSGEVTEWWTIKDTKRLVRYLESSTGIPVDEIWKDVPGNNNSKGRYVCRELAHDYARWLDPCYAYHILKAFDELVQHKIGAALDTATTVARPIINREWHDRYERLIQHVGDKNVVVQYFSRHTSELYSEITGKTLSDPMDFKDYVYGRIGNSMIFERLLNALEIACISQDFDIRDILTHYETDPDFPVFVQICEEYDR